MFRSAAFASVIVLGAIGTVQAQDAGPRLIGGGENAQVVYAGPGRNVVGGGPATISGGGNNQQIVYGPRGVMQAPADDVAELVGGGENAQVLHREAPLSGSLLAGRALRPRG